MEDSNEIVNLLKEWLKAWRVNNGVSEGFENQGNDGILSGEVLDKFVADLQREILNVIGDFGKNSIGENAKLVLYSGTHYSFIQEFCEASNGEYYMISQTVANVLWNRSFRQAVADTIGEGDIKAPITSQVLEGKSYANDTEYGERISQYATESNNYLALDDFLSSKVAEAGLAKGNVVYMVGEKLKADSVGLLTEVPTVLNDANERGINLSDSVTVGKNLTKNADGTFSFETVDCSDVSVYLDQSGKVIFVDFVETILGNPTEITDFTLELDYSDYAKISDKLKGAEIIQEFNKSQVYLSESGEVIGHSFKETKLEGLLEDTIPKDFTIELDYNNHATITEKLTQADISEAIKASQVYLNESGEVIGHSYKGTKLEGLIKDTILSNYALELTHKNHATITDKLTQADISEAIKASEIYLSDAGEAVGRSFNKTKLAGYIEDTIPKGYALKLGYDNFAKISEKFSRTEIAKAIEASEVFLSETGESIGHSFAKTMLNGYIENTIPENYAVCLDYSDYKVIAKINNKVEVVEALNNATVYLNEFGEVIGRSYEGTCLKGLIADTVPDNYFYKTVSKLYREFKNEANMLRDWGEGYNLLDPIEKGKLKELDYLMRVVMGTVEPEAVATATLDYIKGSGKKLCDLNIIDTQLINFCSSRKWNSEMVSAVNGWLESTNGAKFLGKLGTAGKVAVVFTAIATIYDTSVRADKAIIAGNYYEAAGIVAGSCSKFAITFVGGEAFTGVIAPYFIGAGMAIGGPLGALLGGLIAGAIGYGTMSFVGGKVDEWIKGFGTYLDDMYGNATIAVRYDPLVIDLDGDGFELLSVKDGVYFDEDVRGLIEKTEWVAADDALLAIDLNGDGIINDGSELFGTSTLLADGTHAKSGFEALAQYDLNGDGVIDENDEVFAKLKVWQDKNGDGISQVDEIYSLADLGIENISLTTSAEDGRLTANINYKNGATTKIGEFDFESESYNTLEKDLVTVSEEIAGLPNIRSIGSIASLHTLMQIDETGILKGYVEQFFKSSVRKEKEELVTKIIYFITGADDVAAGSRGNQFDAKKLTVIEQFMGREFVGTAGRNPVNTAATILEGVYTDIYNAYYSMLNAQTQLANYMGMVFWTEDENGGKYLNTDVFNSFVSVCAENGNDMTEVVAEMGRFIASINIGNKKNFMDYFTGYIDRLDYAKAITDVCVANSYLGTDANDTYSGTASMDVMFGGAGNDTLRGNNGDDFLYGEEGNDSLYGGNGQDFLVGGEGDDYLYGENGDDVLIGGTGNDYLAGDSGNDTYIFNLGDGKDTVYDYESSATGGKSDRIVFGEGISAEDIRLSRNGNHLVIDYSENDRVTVQDAYYHQDGRCSIESIEFADGTVLAVEDVREAVKVRYGTESADTMYGYRAGYGYDQNETFYAGAGNDTVRGGDGNDTIYGEEGNDYLYGENGDDVLIGGTGNDYLAGDSGNDTYIFNLGDGKDTVYDYESSATGGKSDRIVFGEGISAEDIRLSRNGNHLVIDYSENDSVTVQDAYYHQDGSCCVEYIEFADGTVLAVEDVREAVKVRYGTESADTMYGYRAGYGYDQNETFYAGAGNDMVRGGDGNDTIYGEEGNDYLYGENGDDVLIGGTGNDYLAGDSGNDTYIFNLGDGKDTVYDYESSATGGKSDRIVFGEGISAEDIRLSRNGNHLVIDYSENDSVTVQDAYRYQDDRCSIESIEFADGTKGTLDYANTQLNITAAPTEPEPTDETQIIEMKLSKEQSIEVQPTETELIENTEAIVDSSTDENFDEPKSGQEVIQDTTPSEKMDTTVDKCVGILEDLYTSDQPSDEANNVEIPSEEQSTAIYDNATDAAIDNIVNLLVQDMSESETSTLSDSNTITDVNVINDNVQLWAS